jgi:hypothetical protein
MIDQRQGPSAEASVGRLVSRLMSEELSIYGVFMPSLPSRLDLERARCQVGKHPSP